ncbi:hypothetical protein [Mucilaginibacter sp. SJ]|uniref:hypothetical protein n=1 Tax=Mucilaginibacter sp. SJ TaxID=3029053 RepID=UPI0023A9B735|nr:hypothetical protein [Mucilaginibacter sp. SJ]WEA01825.1 hypothetical protein MusilaSJ_02665 [Mucilaginibacter sp. SJ]
MKITAIMATCGRHYCSERSLSLFLEQNYQDKHLLIYQNSEVQQRLSECIDPSLVTLVNNSMDMNTHQPYISLGAIYNDAIKHLPVDTDIVTFWDDDDLFFDDHLSEGIRGLIRGGKTAYKPASSYFRTQAGMTKERNTFEPSIFVKASHIFKYGFHRTTTDQHLKWLEPLLADSDIYVDEDGKSTLIYNWSDEVLLYKTSGHSYKPDHFDEYRSLSYDHGDRIIAPIPVFNTL